MGGVDGRVGSGRLIRPRRGPMVRGGGRLVAVAETVVGVERVEGRMTRRWGEDVGILRRTASVERSAARLAAAAAAVRGEAETTGMDAGLASNALSSRSIVLPSRSTEMRLSVRS